MQYLGLKALSDQNTERITILENGVALNKLQLENLTERIAINSATLVRTSVNISELNIMFQARVQDILTINADLVGYQNDIYQAEAQINALSNIESVNGTAMILPVDGKVISANDTLTAVADCPSGYRPIKVDCQISGLIAGSFVDASSLTTLPTDPSASLVRETVEGSTGTCSFQIYYIDSSFVQTNIVFDSVTPATPPVTVTAQLLCRAA